MSLSADQLAQRVLTERSPALDISELLGPECDRGAARGSARAGQSQSALARESDLLTLEGHTQQVCCVIGLPEGSIVTGSSDGSIRLWQQKQMQTQKPELESHPLIGHKDSVCSLAFVTQEDALVSGSRDSNVRRWDLHKRIAVDSQTLVDNAEWETGELVREPRGVLLLVKGKNRVYFHKLADGKRVPPELRDDDDAFYKVYVLPNAGTAAELPSGMSSKEKKEKRVFEYTVATGSYSGLVRLWRVRVNLESCNLRECECVAKFGNGGYIAHEKPEGHTGVVLALTALPDGRLASASMEGTLRLWNVNIRECTATLRSNDRFEDVCALRHPSRPNVIAVRKGFNQVLLWDADKGDGNDGNGEMLTLEINSEKIKSSHIFTKFVCVGPESLLYCVLLEMNPCKNPDVPDYPVSYSGRVRLWPISLPTSECPRDQSSRLVFDDLKRVLLALENNGSSAHIEVIKLGAVRLCDGDAPDLAHYLFALPRLSRLELSSAHCDLRLVPEAYISTSASVEDASSSQTSKQAKLTARGLVRILVHLQQIHAQSPSGSTQPVVSLAMNSVPLSWQKICEFVAGRDAELHAEFVAASHASLVEEFTIAMDTASIEEQQLMRMFERVLCVGDLRWPYTLLNAELLSGPTKIDRKVLVSAFNNALEWLAQHAMVDAIAVADLNSVLHSARRHGLLDPHWSKILETKAVVSSVFADARFRSLVSKVNALRADLGALGLRLTRELERLDTRMMHVEKRIEQVKTNVNALALTLERLKEALRVEQRRKDVFEIVKVLLTLAEATTSVEQGPADVESVPLKSYNNWRLMPIKFVGSLFIGLQNRGNHVVH